MDPAPHSTAPREKSIWPMFAGTFVLFALFAGFVFWMLRSGDPGSFDEEAIRAKERYDLNVPLGSAVKPGGFAAAQPTPPPFNAPALVPAPEAPVAEPAPLPAASPAP